MMKKVPQSYSGREFSQNVLSEAEIRYLSTKKQRQDILLKDFTYADFKKILEKAPFSLSEWAEMLYVSERTLHRYANGDGSFNGLQIERILLLEKMIDAAGELFDLNGFKNWLSYKPYALNGTSVKEMLLTHDGIQEVRDLIGRIQYGVAS